MAKILIAYFSHTGENYFGGQIRNITKGNTATVAEAAQRVTGGDLFEIRTVKEYPENYKACCDVAADEGKADARPELAGALHLPQRRGGRDEDLKLAAAGYQVLSGYLGRFFCAWK